MANPVPVTAYRTDDGTLFNTLAEANLYQKLENRRAKIRIFLAGPSNPHQSAKERELLESGIMAWEEYKITNP